MYDWHNIYWHLGRIQSTEVTSDIVNTYGSYIIHFIEYLVKTSASCQEIGRLLFLLHFSTKLFYTLANLQQYNISIDSPHQQI